MPRVCTVCTHELRSTIDRRLSLSAVNFSAIAEEYGLSRDSVRRHHAAHLPALLKTFAEEDEALSVGEIRAEARKLYERTLDHLASVESGVVVDVEVAEDGTRTVHRRKSSTAIQGAMREARASLEQLAKLAGRETATPEQSPQLGARIAAVLARVEERQGIATGEVLDVDVVDQNGGDGAAAREGGGAGLASAPPAIGVGGTPSSESAQFQPVSDLSLPTCEAEMSVPLRDEPEVTDE